MNKLFIPPLGATLTLAKDWSFTLHNERRNDGLVNHLKLKMPRCKDGFYDYKAKMPVTLPAGSELIVRRYYIRLGQSAYDSVTFSVKIGEIANLRRKLLLVFIAQLFLLLAIAGFAVSLTISSAS